MKDVSHQLSPFFSSLSLTVALRCTCSGGHTCNRLPFVLRFLAEHLTLF